MPPGGEGGGREETPGRVEEEHRGIRRHGGEQEVQQRGRSAAPRAGEEVRAAQLETTAERGVERRVPGWEGVRGRGEVGDTADGGPDGQGEGDICIPPRCMCLCNHRPLPFLVRRIAALAPQ